MQLVGTFTHIAQILYASAAHIQSVGEKKPYILAKGTAGPNRTRQTLFSYQREFAARSLSSVVLRLLVK